MSNFQERPAEGTSEYHLYMLKYLANWLQRNPKGTKVVDDELAAVRWAIGLIEGK